MRKERKKRKRKKARKKERKKERERERERERKKERKKENEKKITMKKKKNECVFRDRDKQKQNELIFSFTHRICGGPSSAGNVIQLKLQPHKMLHIVHHMARKTFDSLDLVCSKKATQSVADVKAKNGIVVAVGWVY